MSLSKTKFIRNKVINNALVSIYYAGSGHPGGVLSSIDIILTLFFSEIKKENKKKDKNRFILSKGHSVPALYAVLKEQKYLTNSDLYKLRKLNSITQGHPSVTNNNFIECNTGSLAQGLSFATGLALGYKLKKYKKKIYCMVGDGEMQEGQVWESLMFANHHKLNNLCVILDYNKMQSDDLNKKIMNIEPIKKKIESFGWKVDKINGHDFNQIKNGINKFKKSDKPYFIIANTIKGNGISFMHNKPLWHGSVKMTKEEILQCIKELKINNPKIKIL